MHGACAVVYNITHPAFAGGLVGLNGVAAQKLDRGKKKS